MTTRETQPSNEIDFRHLNSIDDLNEEIYQRSNSGIDLLILGLDIMEKSKEMQIVIALQDSVHQKYLRTNRLKYLSAFNCMRRVAFDMLTELTKMEIKCQQREDGLWLVEKFQKNTSSMLQPLSASVVISEDDDFGTPKLTTRDVGTTTTPADFEENVDTY